MFFPYSDFSGKVHVRLLVASFVLSFDPHMSTAPSPQPLLRPLSLWRSLLQALFLSLLGMSIFEVSKQLIHPSISIWESHVVTIIFSSAIATVITFFVWRRQSRFQDQLLTEIKERTKTEEVLRRTQEELELRVQERTAELSRTNVTLQEQVRERAHAEQIARGQTAVFIRTLQLLATESTLDAFLSHVLTAVTEQFGASSSSLSLYNWERDLMWIEMEYSEERAQPDVQGNAPCLNALSAPLVSTDPIAQLLKQQRTPLVIKHISESPLLSTDLRAWATTTGVQTILVIPLFSENELFGAISVYGRKQHSYQPEELNLAQALAHQALLALRITRLAEQEQRTTILSERTRMARDIHDTLSQGFTGIVIQLEGAEDILDEAPHERETLRSHLTRARTLARESLAEARRSVWELRPHMLEQGDLATAFARSIEQIAVETTVQTTFSLHGVPRPLPPHLEDSLFRIGQEALSNALLHAQARHIQVTLTFDRQQVILQVEDDGQGFDALRQSLQGFGLLSMRERVEQINGHLSIASPPEGGTTLRVEALIPARRLQEVGHDSTRTDTGNTNPHRG